MTPALLDTDMLLELIKLKNATVRRHAVEALRADPENAIAHSLLCRVAAGLPAFLPGPAPGRGA